MKNKKTVIIISIILVILIIALTIFVSVLKEKNSKKVLNEQVKNYTSINDFKTIEEVAAYLECDLKKQETSKSINYKYDIFMKIKYKPYINNTSNELYYEKLCLYSAKVLKYNNFRIIDEKNDVTIEVICDTDSKSVKNIIINGETNYFEKYDSYLEIKKIEDTKTTNFKIQSPIIKKLISNNWKNDENLFGTKESIFEKYNIYFDEGIKVKEVSGKVFNIIFTEKYTENIVNNIKTNISKDEIIKILGEPTYKDSYTETIGYKGDDIYLFYNPQKEISIYRIEKDFDGIEFAKMVDEYLESKDEEKLIQNVKNKYKDYDEYENNSSGIILKYSLKGIEIKFKKGASKGIRIYNNYKGVIYKDINLEILKQTTTLPDNVFVKNEDLVVMCEIERVSNVKGMIDNSKQESLSNKDLSKSNKFYLIKELLTGGVYKVKFISIDKSCPDTELRESIDYWLWMDDYNFIYSIKNKGIYLYNLYSRKYTKIIEATNEEFKLIEYKDNILKYDDKSIKLKNN